MKGGQMAYIITGTATFSNQNNRDSALGRVNTALAGYSITDIQTLGFTAGINTPTSTTMTISISCGDDDNVCAEISKAIYGAWTQSNRHTQGYLSMNKV
jgi:hypothetical protein